MLRRHASFVAGAVVLLTACSGSAPPTTTTQPPPTTAAPTTTTTTTTTTTLSPLAFSSDGVDPVIDGLVEALYRHVLEAGSAPPLPAGLMDHLRGASGEHRDVAITTIASVLKYGQAVAVVTAGPDTILLADETEGWKIVGADLPSQGLDPWFGPPRRAVLIIGSDARWNEKVETARSDSIHIVTAVGAESAGAIVGIPRDSWVETPSGGNGKITNVLANHGPDGVMETVELISGVELEGWIMTGFLGFERISADFGPFEIDLPARVPASAGLPGFPAGPQVVEPPEDLLSLARIRKSLPNGDFDRSFNHGVIMLGALRSAQERGTEALPALVTILDDLTFTSFLAGDILNLAATSLLMEPGSVTNVVVPGSVGATSGGASIVRLRDGAAAIFADQADDGLLNDSHE